MNARAQQDDAIALHARRPCERLPILALAERIALRSCCSALRELHDHRPCFQLNGNEGLLLAEFVHALQATHWARGLAGGHGQVLEEARDLTLDKFTLLPRRERQPLQQGFDGPDCRRYFSGFLRSMAGWTEDHPTAPPWQREAAAPSLLQHMVVRHFRLSCQEARRNRNPAMSRYAWHVNGGVIRVLMSRTVAGHRRSAWLEAHVEDPDPARPEEQVRVQTIVDRELGVPHRVPLEGDEAMAPHHGHQATPSSLAIKAEINLQGLPRTVADEKADHIDEQRPAIRALGTTNLKRLILQVFDRLLDDRYEEKQLAEQFGLSRATFSRFAGSRWQAGADRPPPDLWANVARTLAGHTTFMEAARDAGVWHQVEQTLARARAGRE